MESASAKVRSRNSRFRISASAGPAALHCRIHWMAGRSGSGINSSIGSTGVSRPPALADPAGGNGGCREAGGGAGPLYLSGFWPDLNPTTKLAAAPEKAAIPVATIVGERPHGNGNTRDITKTQASAITHAISPLTIIPGPMPL